MIPDTIPIIRRTLWWGAIFVGMAFVIRALGMPIEPHGVLFGAAYAIVAVKFYSIVAGAIWGQAGEVRRFAVWFPIKMLSIIGAVFLLGRSTTGEIFSALFGFFAFVPAGFEYARREGARDDEIEARIDGDNGSGTG